MKQIACLPDNKFDLTSYPEDQAHLLRIGMQFYTGGTDTRYLLVEVGGVYQAKTLAHLLSGEPIRGECNKNVIGNFQQLKRFILSEVSKTSNFYYFVVFQTKEEALEWLMKDESTQPKSTWRKV